MKANKAPRRHPIQWKAEEYTDPSLLEAETRRVFDVCHGCRRCFNLCDVFPSLFDLLDHGDSGELDTIATSDLNRLHESCTLCDMCFIAKCPYVPPHELDIDFPQLMLRHRHAAHQNKEDNWIQNQLSKTDRNGKIGTALSGLINPLLQTPLVRQAIEKQTGVSHTASLPPFENSKFKPKDVFFNEEGPAFGQKAVIYTTCYGNYHDHRMAHATHAILAFNGVKTEFAYPECCGMPQLEQGDLDDVSHKAKRIIEALSPWVDSGYAVIALVPSCAFMLKEEWPLLLPYNEGAQRLAKSTFDVTEYIMHLEKNMGLIKTLQALPGGVSLHMACHARAQNIGRKAEEMLKLIPEAEVSVVERCSGHGGSWGVMNTEKADKGGHAATQLLLKQAKTFLASECPLAGNHLAKLLQKENLARSPHHPIELLAHAYGLIKLDLSHD